MHLFLLDIVIVFVVSVILVVEIGAKGVMTDAFVTACVLVVVVVSVLEVDTAVGNHCEGFRYGGDR